MKLNMHIKNQIIVNIIFFRNWECFSYSLKNNNELIFETWKQKLVTMVVAVTVGGGVTTVAMKVPHPTPCRKLICTDSVC
jgi:hypothetical protein